MFKAIFGGALLALASAQAPETDVRALLGTFKASVENMDTTTKCYPQGDVTFTTDTTNGITLNIGSWTGSCAWMTATNNNIYPIVATGKDITYTNIVSPTTQTITRKEGNVVRTITKATTDTIKRTADNTNNQETVVFTLTFAITSQDTTVGTYTYDVTFTRGPGAVKCLTTEYSEAGVCKTCPEHCTTCTSAQVCTGCADNYWLPKEDGVCIAECPAGQYGDTTTKKCTSCGDHCSQCTDANTCTTCEAHFFLPKEGNAGACTKCTDGLFGDSKTGRCTDKCTEGSYGDATSAECLACAEHCLTCKSDKVCTSCDDKYWLPKEDGVCIDKCPTGQYGDTTSKRCTLCAEHCTACTDANTCTACDAHFFLPKDGTGKCDKCTAGLFGDSTTGHCTDKCTEGFYGDTDSGECTTCNTACKTCSAKDVCLTCEPGTNTYLPPKDETPQICRACHDREFVNEAKTHCEKCPVLCLGCSSLTICSGCESRSGFSGEEKVCKACAAHEISESNECRPCQAHHVVEGNTCKPCGDREVVQGHKCHPCEANQIINGDECKTCQAHQFVEGNECKDCMEGCESCTGKDTCTKCNEKDYKKEGDKCIKKSNMLLWIILGVLTVVVIGCGIFYFFYRKNEANKLKEALVYKSAASME